MSHKKPLTANALFGKQWPSGIKNGINYFPIGVWVQDPKNAAIYKTLGINYYYGLFGGPTELQLSQLKAAGMPAFCPMNSGVALNHLNDPTILGWMSGPDEPDNAQNPSHGILFVQPSSVQQNYNNVKNFDTNRPVIINLGQGVASPWWVGHGAGFSGNLFYPQYVKATDIVSYDIYPVSDLGTPSGNVYYDGSSLLYLCTSGVKNLVNWGAKRIITHVETTKVNQSRDIEANYFQMRSEIWQSIIAGSRGIVYFCHTFNPFDEAHLLHDPVQSGNVYRLNKEIQSLAKYINIQERNDLIRIISIPHDPLNPSGGPPVISYSARVYGNTIYLFTACLQNVQLTASFQVNSSGKINNIVNLNENKNASYSGNVITDTYAPYGVHLYKITL
jgi:hypothetical protein